jgi:hypothetical protein
VQAAVSVSVVAMREPDVARYQHAAREIERFAHMRVYESTTPRRLICARKLLRLAVGMRRLIDQWPPAEE